LPCNISVDLVRVEELTGEVYLDYDTPGLTPKDVRAIHKRLGNMASMAALRDQVGDILGISARQSLLLNKVLYSGTHGGDVIPVEDRDRLKDEILLIREKPNPQVSPELDTFLSDMEELVAASERHGNPIVFI
jgi:hypothetical protein